MLEHVQIIEEHGQAKFAVIDFEECLSIKALLSEPEKLADYLDYLHMQAVKKHRLNAIPWQRLNRLVTLFNQQMS